MKRTDLMRKERELKRARKKADRLERSGAGEKTVGDYISELNDLLFHDDTQIYNAGEDVKILELLEEIKEEVEPKNWDNILRKAVKKTGVKKKDKAFKELKALMSD